jgi:hypothetical protein
MINEASEVSNELEITRVDMDRFAERSHRLAAEATTPTLASYDTVADAFPYLAKTPANAAKQALEKIGKSAGDIDLPDPRARNGGHFTPPPRSEGEKGSAASTERERL